MKKLHALAILTLLLAGCATSSKDIAGTFQSPMVYRGYDCAQLAEERDRLNVRVRQLGGRLDEAASNDKKIAAAGAILFWPALFALGGTKQQEAEYATLKGQHDALEQASIEKRCAATVAQPAPLQAGAKARGKA
jgi:hypothetical protein